MWFRRGKSLIDILKQNTFLLEELSLDVTFCSACQDQVSDKKKTACNLTGTFMSFFGGFMLKPTTIFLLNSQSSEEGILRFKSSTPFVKHIILIKCNYH